MARWLVFGLSGRIGQAFADALQPGEQVVAASRRPGVDGDGVQWLQGALQDLPPPAGPFDGIASLGPLDAFARWFATADVAPARVVAVGSTSVHCKHDSPDAAERDVAARLAAAEASLAETCVRRGSALVVLRPTLVYGGGTDQSLDRLVALARRWRWLPVPANARGLRQPVHAADVAAAALVALRSPAPVAGAFDLPGGETLAWRDMVARTLATAAPGARVLPVPAPLFRLGVRLARGLGRLPGAGEGVLSRLDRDLVFDAGPARAALGFAPRLFTPDRDPTR